MKKFLLFLSILCFSIVGCDPWTYSVPTFPAPPPSITPVIYTPTPLIRSPTSTIESPTNTSTEPAPPITPTNLSLTPIFTASLPPLPSDISVNIIGCDTSIDIAHGMGEVTNAYVTLQNNTGKGVTNLSITLFAIDEGRIHPDKIASVPVLDHGMQVTMKLTVDSTYQENTLIQVEVKSDETLLSRIDNPSCENIGLFAPNPDLLLTPIPIQQ